MNRINPNVLYKVAAVCFVMAAVIFLITGMFNDFENIYIILTVVFTVNAMIWFTLDKTSKRQD